MRNKSKERKFVSSLHFKEDEGILWVEGHVSMPGVDDALDNIPSNVQEMIVEQINSGFNKGTVHHNFEKDPAWIAKEAWMSEGGAYIKGFLNKNHPKYDDYTWEVKNGILDTFSIEFLADPLSHTEWQDGKEIRVFDDIQIRGIGLASKGRSINPHLEPLTFLVKEMIPVHAIRTKQPTHMEETRMEKKEEGKPAEEKVPASEEKKPTEDKPKETEEKKKEVEDEKSEEKKPAEESAGDDGEKEKVNVNAKDYKEYQKFKAHQTKEYEEKEFERRFKEQLDNMNVVAKPKIVEGGLDSKEGNTAYLSFKEKIMRTDPKTQLSVKEQFRMATELAVKSNAFDIRLPLAGKGEPKQFKCVGPNNNLVQLEMKAALTTTSNDPATDAVTNYYQAAVELGDFYDPVISNVLNDQTTTYGRLPKRNLSDRSAIQVRVRDGRNSSAGAYSEGAATLKSFSSRQRLSQPFKYYQVGVQVTGQQIQSAKGRGGVGDIFAIEVEDASRDLLVDINNDLLNSTGAAAGSQLGTVSDEEIMSFEYVTDSGNNTTIYGYTRSSFTFLQTGHDTAAGSTAITKGRLRTMFTALELNGARKSDMVIFTSHEQRDMILNLFDDMQRIMNISARAGFEGLPEFDTVPVFPDQHCNDDHLFCMDLAITYIGVQVPPTFEELAKNNDTRSGFIKTYLNLMVEAPYRCGQIDGLSTS